MPTGNTSLRNNGYVKRVTKYHNTLLANDMGQWGEVRTWFTPWPLTPSRDAKIVEATSSGASTALRATLRPPISTMRA